MVPRWLRNWDKKSLGAPALPGKLGLRGGGRAAAIDAYGQGHVAFGGVVALAKSFELLQVLPLGVDHPQEDVGRGLVHVADHLGIEDVVLVALLGDGVA